MDIVTLTLAKKYTDKAIVQAAVGDIDVEAHVKEKVDEVLGDVSEKFNTLEKIEDEVDKKVDKVEGKGLSTNDFTNTYKSKVDSALQSYTETDPTVPSWAKAANKPSYAYSEITGKPTLSTVATSGSYNDLTNKPTIPSIAGLATEEYVNNAVANIVLISEGGKKFKLTVDDAGALTATEITE